MSQTYLLFLFGDLGDTILTVPAIRAIRRSHPEARLVLLCKAVAASYVGELDLVDAIVEVEKHAFDRLRSLLRPRVLIDLLLLVRRIRRERADTTVLFHHLVTNFGAAKFGLLSLASGAPRRVGLDDGRGWFLTDRIVDRGFGSRHEAQYWMDVAGLVGGYGALELEARSSGADRQRADELLAPLDGRQLVAVHPGTGRYGPGRKWPAERFAQVVQLLRQREAFGFVIVGTRQDIDEVDRVVGQAGAHVLNLCGRTSTGELAAVLERCSLLVANDGGVGHLASAVGIPVLAVFGPSNDGAWRPLTATVVSRQLPCRPCFYRDHERGLPAGCATRECLTQISAARVAAAALSLLRERALAS